MSSRRTRVALVGAGSVARRHAQVLSRIGGVEIATVADPVFDSAESLARDCGARAFADFTEAIDAAQPDAVYICVPPFAHGAAERLCIERGLPMFVEKPLAADLATAEAVAALLPDSLVTGTGYHWRCLDIAAHAAQLLEAAPPLLASGWWLDKRPPVPWWAQNSRSGGQLVEQLTHVIDLARMLLGEAAEAHAVGVQRPHDGDRPAEDDVDDATAAVVKFSSGAVATFAATSLLTAKYRAALTTISPGLVLELSEARLVVDDGASQQAYDAQADAKVLVDAEFIAAVRGEREQTRAPYQEALKSHRLACALATSAMSGRTVSVG